MLNVPIKLTVISDIMLSVVMLVVVMYRVVLITKKDDVAKLWWISKIIFQKLYQTTFGANVIKLLFIFDYECEAKKAYLFVPYLCNI